MNQKNVDYLKNELKYSGFDTSLNAELEKKIQQGNPTFELATSNKIGEDKVDYTLHFRKSDQTEMYFFNLMDATLRKPGGPEEGTSQTFYQNQNITAKEAYNLLDGRAVYKSLTGPDNEKYNAWVQLDFKDKDNHDNYKVHKFNDNYGYDVDKALKSLPIKELGDATLQERLVKSMKKGNLHEVTLQVNGTEQKAFINANPQYKAIDVYDAGMNRLNSKELRESAGESQKTEQKKGEAQKDLPDRKPKQKTRKGPSHA